MKTAELSELRKMVERFEPDVVIGSGFDEGDVQSVPGWIKLSLDLANTTTIRVRGNYSKSVNPTLDSILAIIEEVEQHT